MQSTRDTHDRLIHRARRTGAALAVTALAFGAAAPARLAAQASAARPAAIAAAVRPVPLSAAARRRFVGSYTIDGEPGQPTTPLRVFEDRGALRGQLRQNVPSPLVYQGANVFRVESAPGVVLRFAMEGGRATRVAIVSPAGTLRGTRDADAAAAPPDQSASGPLFTELARMDSLLFDAAYVTCDAARANAFFAEDAEFYHDKGGFHEGAQVRADFERLTRQCPRTQGVTRELVPGSLHVYPIADYGAVQVGVHRFVQRGGGVTGARFVHLWRRQPDGGWKLTRVLSYDHAPTNEP